MSNIEFIRNANSSINLNPKLSITDIIILIIVFIRFCDPLNLVFNTTGVYAIYYGLFFVFLFQMLLNKSSYFIELLKCTWILILFIVVITLRSYFAGNLSFGFSDPMKMIILFFNMIIACSVFIYVKDRSSNMKRKLTLTALISLLISVIYSSYYVTFIDYLAVRNATAVDLGVGDFNLIYVLMFIPIFVLANFNNKNRKRLLLFLLFIFLASVYLLIQANFMTAIIIYLFSTALTFLLVGSNNMKKKFWGSLLTVLLTIFFLIFKKNIGLSIISLAQKDVFSWVINNKLIVIGQLFMGIGDDMETLGIRMEKIQYTISTFLDNPIFGVNYADYNAYTIGGHAQWFDELARYGGMGVIILLVFYFKTYFNAIRLSSNLKKNEIKVAWILFIVMGFLNPNTMSTVTMMLFAVIPFCGYLSKSTGNDDERKEVYNES